MKSKLESEINHALDKEFHLRMMTKQSFADNTACPMNGKDQVCDDSPRQCAFAFLSCSFFMTTA
jgi:hypothetical protein